MTDTGWMFRASWPILQPDLPLSVLLVEACEQVDQMAKEERCRLVGEVVWTVEDGRLYGRSAAVPLPERKPREATRPRYGALERSHELIASLAAQGLTDEEIVDQLGVGGTASGVYRVRERHGIAPGSQQQRKGRAA